MSKEYKRREAIFNKYSRNLEWTQENPRIGFNETVQDGYVCPLCFGVFTREDLKDTCENPLTFDHNPPEALGGKSGVLTCKDCNSKSGSKLDSQLLKVLMENDFRDRKPYTKMRTTLETEGNKIAVDVSVDEKGKTSVTFLKKHSNPKYFDNLFEGGKAVHLSTQPVFGDKPQVPVTIKNPMAADVRRAEVTCLKIAYLKAFELFGYGMLIHPFMPIIRHQILHPAEIVLPNILSMGPEIPRDLLGFNLLRSPKEFRCFVIGFEVHTKSTSRIFAVPLPGWSEPGLDIYFPDKHKQFSKTEMTVVNTDFTNFSGFDWVAEKGAAFTATDIWFNFEKEQSGP
jgi:hypothetical protein